ncbi:MAG: radical SAM protein [Actinobacteria bacterium]|nr:radical SAM protein [Actinomycetota bacterium]
MSVILKLRGETCNIDCLYCFEKRKEAPGGATIGPADVARLATTFGTRPLAVELHGGEPLTAGRATIGAILDQLAAQPNVVRVSLQTNGMLLDDAWLDLFDTYCPALEIGISLDGDPQGNSWRVGYDGRPAYPKIAAALGLLGRRGKRVGVISVVTRLVLGRAAHVLDHLAGFTAIRAVNFAPCFDSTITEPTTTAARRPPASRELQQQAIADPSGPRWAVTPDEYAAFVLAAAGHWITSGLFRRLKLEPAVSTIRRLRGAGSESCHFSDRKCDHVLTLYPAGRVGSCDELPWPQAHLANLAAMTTERDVIAAQRRSPLLAAGKALTNKCRTCDYRTTCMGGCISTRHRERLAVGDDNGYCAHRMRLVDGIAALLAEPHRPQAAFCRSIQWRPRHPNTMLDVGGFLARWDGPLIAQPNARLCHSAYGNINTAGLPGVHDADDLHPNHPQWREAIEPGVWPLVDALTTEWGCVTYDSCQGHAYDGLELAPTALRVGILPRSRVESGILAARVCQVAAAICDMPRACQLAIGRSEIACKTTGAIHPALDISLLPVGEHGWPGYFTVLGEAVAVLTAALRISVPSSEPVCACHT